MAANHLKNATTNQKSVLLVVEVFKRDTNDGDGYKGSRQATAMRVMALATTMGTTWEIALVVRLAGDEEGEGKSGKGNSNSDKRGVRQRGGGQQGNVDGDKDGRQVDYDGNE